METAIEAQQRPLEEKFPVSTGVEHKSHKEEEGGAQKASESINIFAKFQVCLIYRGWYTYVTRRCITCTCTVN